MANDLHKKSQVRVQIIDKECRKIIKIHEGMCESPVFVFYPYPAR